MDIQKENNLIQEAFNDEAHSRGFCLDQEWSDCENPYLDGDTNLAFDFFKSGWQAAKAVPDKYTQIVLVLESVQSKIAKTSFLTMDEENENEVMAVDANELAAYIDKLIEAQEPANDI